MNNLFKNTLRSLKNSKVAVVGLTFLVFLAVGIFTLLSSTTSNVTNEYANITKKANLHDITINEKYNVGNIRYDFIENIDAKDAWFAPTDEYVGYSTEDESDPQLVSWVDKSVADQSTFRLGLDVKSTDLNSFVQKVFEQVTSEERPWTDPVYPFLFPVVTLSNDGTDTYTYENGAGTYLERPQSTEAMDSISEQNQQDRNILTGDAANDVALNFYNYLNNQYTTPMVEELQNNYADKVSFRQFKSLDINASPDHIYYKAVVSNPDIDTVDKMTLFSGTDNFANSDWNIPSLLPLKDGSIPNVGDILSFKVPGDRPTDKNSDEYARTKDKFIVLNMGATTPEFHTMFTKLSTGDTFDSSAYSNYVSYQQTEIYTNKIARFSFQWTSGAVPTTWFLDDWTSYFTVIAPQYAAKHNLRASSTDIFTKYPTWSGDEPTRNNIIKWLNKLEQNDLETWFKWVNNNYKNNVVNVGTGTPYIITGTGITADFLYPIVSIEHSIPNTNNEAITYINNSGYERLLDSWRSMPSEQYLVLKAINGNNVNQLIEQFKVFCQQNMTWPQNVTNVFSATDTHNTLSAAAFRIAFIPQLVHSISIVDITLTVFVLFLLLIIAITIIKRFIDNNRVNIGVAQAIGIEKHKIAFSLLPFGLISSVIGGVLGYLLGLFLQIPTLGLLSAYWTIPTATIGFNWVSLLLMFTIPFVIFVGISIAVTYTKLRIKTTYLMKSGSEYRVNLVSKYIKKPFKQTNIITRFRISLAFNSMWKLIVMSMLTGMAITTIVFSWSINGKIEKSMNASYQSKNYQYAIDLFSPTTQSGQYLPVDNTKFAESGWTTTQSEGTNFIPNLLFQNETVWGGGWDKINLVDPAYGDVLKSINTTKLAKTYYDMPELNMNIDYILGKYPVVQKSNPLSLGAALDASDHNVIGSNTFYPNGADAVGQKYDLQYLKNRTATKSMMDFTIGIKATGLYSANMSSNPWSIAKSLMPNNQLTQCTNTYEQIIQLAGMKASVNTTTPNIDYATSNKHPAISLPGYNPNNEDAQYDNPYSEDPFTSDYGQFFTMDDDGNFTIDSSKCMDEYHLALKVPIIGTNIETIDGFTNISPDYIKFINGVYRQLEWPDEYGKITNPNDLAMEHDYLIRYNTIPLSNDEETYTYIDIANSKIKGVKVGDSAKIMGIKANTNYIDLMQNKKNINNLLNVLPTPITKQATFPIIVNAYAQKKYGLNVGDTFSVNLTNNANRFDWALHGQNPATANFKVVGVCDTYIGEEYYINQDVANYLLDLKNNIDKNIDVHAYYPDITKTVQTEDEDLEYLAGNNYGNDLISFPGKEDGLNTKASSKEDVASPGVTYDTNDLYDLGDTNPDTKITKDAPDGKNITPYGFNGVFTKNKNGSQLLSNGISLYSPSGLYPGNDRLNQDTLTDLLKYGANLQIASQILGLWNGIDNLHNTDLGNKIYQDWRAWMYPGGTLSTNFAYDESDTYDKYVSHLDEFIKVLTDTFGNNAVVSLVQNVLDKTSTQTVFNNVATTITEIESIIIATIATMFVLIIMLLTSLIVGDSKKLGGILKSIGYRDHINIISFLSIYAPTIIIGGLLALPLSLMMNAIFTSVVFNGMGILALVSLHTVPVVAALGATIGLFLICGSIGYAGLKKDKIAELIKGV